GALIIFGSTEFPNGFMTCVGSGTSSGIIAVVQLTVLVELGLFTDLGLVEGGEVRADGGSVGLAEVGVEGQCALVVVPGEGGLAEGCMGAAESGVGARLLAAGADVAGDGEGGGVPYLGIGGAVGGARGFAEAVVWPCLQVAVTGVAGQGKGVPVVLGGSVGLTEGGVDDAQVVQHVGLAGPVTDLPESPQCPLVVVDGLLAPVLAVPDQAEA